MTDRVRSITHRGANKDGIESGKFLAECSGHKCALSRSPRFFFLNFRREFEVVNCSFECLYLEASKGHVFFEKCEGML